MRAGNVKFSSLAAEKQLTYHPTKSCYLVYGPDWFKSKVELEAEEEPVMLGKDVIHEKEQEKYLGDILSSLGLSASVRATVRDRTAKVKGSIYELRAVVEDVRMQAAGGFEAAIDLYESCIVPSLMANCSTWVEINKKTEEELDALQDLFGRALLQVPKSTPRLSVRAALGLLGSRWRIWQEKVLLVLALKQQEEGCLAKEVLEEQMRMGWPGLGQEVKEICEKIGLPDATCKTVNIEKEAVKEAILLHHHKHLKQEMTGKKMEMMARTDMRRRREYTKFGVEDCVWHFASRHFSLTVGLTCRLGMAEMSGAEGVIPA